MVHLGEVAGVADVIELHTIEGGKRPLDASVDLVEAIKDAIYEHGVGLPLTTILGALEIAKLEILRDSE